MKIVKKVKLTSNGTFSKRIVIPTVMCELMELEDEKEVEIHYETTKQIFTVKKVKK